MLEGGGELVVIGRDSVPFVGSFHEVYTTAHVRPHEDHDRFALSAGCTRILEDAVQVVKVVAIALKDGPAECGPFGAEVTEGHHVLYGAVDLLAVPVDEADEVVDAVMGRVEGGLPNLSFLQFAIAVKAVHPAILSVELLGLCRPTGDAQSLSKGSTCHPDAGQALFGGRVTLKSAVEFPECGQFPDGEVAPA